MLQSLFNTYKIDTKTANFERPNSMEAGKRLFNDIFNKSRILLIPFFQRSYVWEEENWIRFLEDMEKVSQNKAPYFMGAVILKQTSAPSNERIGDIRVVVDGQQRLTTLCLFFKELFNVLNMPEYFSDLLLNRDRSLILRHNHNDSEIFQELLMGAKLSSQLATKYSDNQVFKCHQYFRSQKERLKDLNPDTILNNIYFVGIDLTAGEDEQQIFDSINSLGVSLSTAELLKNELFKTSADEPLFNSTWKTAFENSEEIKKYWDTNITSGRHQRANIDILIQSFLIISTEASEKYLRLDSLFASYKHFLTATQKSKQEIIQSLIYHAKLYQENIDPEINKSTLDAECRLDRVLSIAFALNITTVIPYLLFVLSSKEDQNEKNQIYGAIETFIIRRHLVKGTTKNYNNFFNSLIRNKVSKSALLLEKLYNSDDQTTGIPNDAALKEAFLNNSYTNQVSKVILYLIEASIRDRKHSTTLRPLDEYSVEHIMPKKWRNHWLPLDSEGAREARDNAVLRMGNLTIIPGCLNSSIRDANWATKKDGRDKKPGLREYAAGISIFSRQLEKDHWDESAINQRTIELLNHARNIWPYQKESR